MTASSATVDPLLLDDIPGMVVFAAVAERGSFPRLRGPSVSRSPS